MANGKEQACSDFSTDEYAVMEDFVLMTSSKQNLGKTASIVKDLISSIPEDRHLYSYWLVSDIDSADILHEQFKCAVERNKLKIAKTIAWRITNMFYSYHKQIFSCKIAHTLIWPGFLCNCQGKDRSRICSNQFQIVIETHERIKNLPTSFGDFNIQQLVIDRENCDSRTAFRETSENYTEEHIIDNNFVPGVEAERLFNNHSKLCLICPSVVKVTDSTTTKLQCIQLHCAIKGTIPIGEKHFPAFVGNYPTDVLEGRPQFASNKLRLGTKICTRDCSGHIKCEGTLGGFIKHLGFECFLTCAHVVFDFETLLSRIDDGSEENGINVFFLPDNSSAPIQCGKVFRRIFEHDDKDKTSIDAALILMQNSSCDQNDIVIDQYNFSRPVSAVGMSSVDIKDNCIDLADVFHPNKKVKVLCPGAFKKMKDELQFSLPIDWAEVQFPTPGQLIPPSVAQPLVIASPAHMQLNANYLTGTRVFRMYNQLLVNVPLGLGDSGTCIYVTENNGRTGCLGMAIAFFSGGMSIVTPMRDILKKIRH